MRLTKIYFVKNDERIPFSDFLLREKENRGDTWKQMDRICGIERVNAYALATYDGMPNSPPHHKFQQIIKSLGYTEHDFEVEKLVGSGRKSTREEYENELRRLGNDILMRNERHLARGERPQKLSTTAVKMIISDAFYIAYGKGYDNMKKLHQDMIALDPKYEVIDLQHIDESNRTVSRPLQNFESDVIQESILAYIATHPPTKTRLPKGIIPFVTNKLNTALDKRGLPPRTPTSVPYHVHRIWDNKKSQITLTRGSPSSSIEGVNNILDEQLDRLSKTREIEPQHQALAESIVEADDLNKRRNNFYKYGSVGHHNLVLFLMEPTNYKEYCGRDLSLFAVDFPTGDIDENLLAIFKEKCAELEAASKNLQDDAYVVDFVAGWLRCDMIFRKRGGGFVVVEVKQYAIDKMNGFKNATKACQQLSGYCAILLDNIIRYNLDNISRPNYKPIKESVEGYLAAYEIEAYFQVHLNRAGNRRPIVIPKAEVEKYIAEILSQAKDETLPSFFPRSAAYS